MLDPTQLKFDILNLTQELETTTDLPATREVFAEKLSALIHNYVRSATVIFPPGTIQILAGGTAGSNPAPVRGTLT